MKTSQFKVEDIQHRDKNRREISFLLQGEEHVGETCLARKDSSWESKSKFKNLSMAGWYQGNAKTLTSLHSPKISPHSHKRRLCRWPLPNATKIRIEVATITQRCFPIILHRENIHKKQIYETWHSWNFLEQAKKITNHQCT